MLGASEMPEKGVWCGFKTEVRRTVDLLIRSILG